MERRTFVATLAAAGSAAGSPRLAMEGGTPVRATPLRGDYWGPLHYDQAERSQVTEVIDTGMPFRFSGRAGRTPAKVADFEKAFAARMQTRFALAVSSGTGALETAVAALGIGPGEEVIVPAWTWHSTATAVIRCGALPVFAEIDDSFNLDPGDIEPRLTRQTRAIMVAHLQNNVADLEPILAIARKRGLKVIEDCAQCVGGSYRGKPLGSLGDIGIYSHQASKTITSGEGGTLVTSDPALFERACRFHDVGNLAPVHREWIGNAGGSPMAGTNFRMSELAGGVMLAQLRKLDRIIAAVRANAQLVYDGLRDLPGIRWRRRPDPEGDLAAPVFFAFATKAQRDRFLEAMKAENVPAVAPGGSAVLPVQPYIENKVAHHPAWPTWTTPRGKAIRYGAASCPRTLDILGRYAGVAVGPKYSRQELDDIVAAVRKVYPVIAGAAG
jgi:8-amino-3,8-dideoxy-alpha-D-manno-octulosonate transaminase